jgi:hypothetical protein
MPSGIYTNFKRELLTGVANFYQDTIVCVLLNKDYIPDYEEESYYREIKKYEISGDGYNSKVLYNVRVVVNKDNVALYADDISWTGTIKAQYAVLYINSYNCSLICCFDFGEEKQSNNGEFKIQWHEDGILNLC